MCFCEGIGPLLVGNAGKDDPDIDTAFSGEFQGGFELSVEYQVGGHDIDVACGAVEDIHIDALADLVIVERAVGIWHNIALCILREDGVGEVIPIGSVFGYVPHMEEHEGKASDGSSLEHYG